MNQGPDLSERSRRPFIDLFILCRGHSFPACNNHYRLELALPCESSSHDGLVMTWRWHGQNLHIAGRWSFMRRIHQNLPFAQRASTGDHWRFHNSFCKWYLDELFSMGHATCVIFILCTWRCLTCEIEALMTLTLMILTDHVVPTITLTYSLSPSSELQSC